jgi:hypothetical protein
MTRPGLVICELSFRGPNVDPVGVELRPGLNVIEGATETGKSFILQVIDFMLGGGSALRDLPERIPYDTIVLKARVSDGILFTVQRSAQGGRYLWREGHHDVLDIEADERLLEKHGAERDDNLSNRLLRLLGLQSHHIRQKANEARPLSFRDLAHLAYIDEERIIRQISPVLSENFADNPREKAMFKFALTGIDDSSIIAAKSALDKVELAKQKLAGINAVLQARRAAAPSADILGQRRLRLAELEEQLSSIAADVSADETRYFDTSRRRRLLDRIVSDGRSRGREIEGLLSRFDLLEQHYETDIQRLEAIEETSALMATLLPGPCPFCGAAPEAHRHDEGCDIDPAMVRQACEAEIARVQQLRGGLADTRKRLERERRDLDKRITANESEVERVKSLVFELSAQLRERRRGVGDLSREVTSLRDGLRGADVLQELDDERARLVQALEAAEAEVPEKVAAKIPTAATSRFVELVEKTLTTWNVPDVGRVQWNEQKTDLVIGPRQRADRGKGLRALTCSAFILTLLQECRANGLPHPGFVALDSPLLSYREPDGDDDDLSGTDVEDQFYKWIVTQTVAWQVIIVENKTSPAWVKNVANVIHFTRNHHSGRYGLFPSRQALSTPTV